MYIYTKQGPMSVYCPDEALRSGNLRFVTLKKSVMLACLRLTPSNAAIFFSGLVPLRAPLVRSSRYFSVAIAGDEQASTVCFAIPGLNTQLW